MKRIAIVLVLLPPAATASLACNCPDEGSAIELSGTTLLRNPTIGVSAGDATLQCVERTNADQCSTYWIVPHASGPVTVTATFPDRTSVSDTVDYLHDGHYPCRGDLRPEQDHITHF